MRGPPLAIGGKKRGRERTKKMIGNRKSGGGGGQATVKNERAEFSITRTATAPLSAYLSGGRCSQMEVRER